MIKKHMRKRLKKLFWVLVVLFILALDWAALHDIAKGEPNLYAEYSMLVASVIIFIGILAYEPYKS